MTVLLGAVADDLTGATDLANTLVRSGMRVTQVVGVPSSATVVGEVDAVVVSIKSRTAPRDDAIAWSLDSLRWLRAQGAVQFLFKYCSTFDSTAEGNIGPVADALLDELGGSIAAISPAFPENARTIYLGHLFVGDQLLSDSPMKDHPLTPMRDANLMRLMDAQSKYRTGLVPLATVRAGTGAITQALQRLTSEGYRYAVLDTVADEEFASIGRALAEHPLVTGGSAIAMGLVENFRAKGMLQSAQKASLPRIAGREAVLAGSCSVATRGQIEHVRDRWPTQKIDIESVAAGEPVAERILAWTDRQSDDTPLLVFGSSNPDEVAANQRRFGVQRAGEMIENVLSDVARGLVEKGFRRLVVAGGETAGAVVSGLEVSALRIGPEIDPGVPWTQSLGNVSLALALKSGNFGAPDFFERSFRLLDEA